eukprot:m51a1_g3650 hypothetical protein (327) ;mRNA; r:206853-208439
MDPATPDAQIPENVLVEALLAMTASPAVTREHATQCLHSCGDIQAAAAMLGDYGRRVIGVASAGVGGRGWACDPGWRAGELETDEEYARRLQRMLDEDTTASPTPRAGGGSGRAPQQQQQQGGIGPLLFDFTALSDEQRGQLSQAIVAGLVPLVTDSVSQLRIPRIEDRVELEKFGEVHFGIVGLSVETVTIPQEKVSITINNGQLTISMEGIAVSLRRFNWFYKKERKFPSLKDDGNATARISHAKIHLVIDTRHQEANGSLTQVKECQVTLTNLSIKVAGTKASVLYNLVLLVIKRFLKRMLEQSISNMITQTISTQDAFHIKL